ncbi:MAG: AmmeMemoRadiSam system protein B [Thermodesulfobacteriota bacterium]
MNTGKPKIREDLEFIPVKSEGRTVIMIRDRLDLVQQGNAINPELYMLLAMLDGTRSIRDIQLDLMRQLGGRLITTAEIERIVAELESSYLLDGRRYRDRKAQIVDDFRAQPIRYPAHAGLSYPKDPEELRMRLDDFLAAGSSQELPEGTLAALVAPHIDLEAGKGVYASAYRAVTAVDPERIIILGVGHAMQKEMFSLTTKPFETPLGTVDTDREAVGRLQASNHLISKDDFPHRDEHSIEFQLIFLQHVLKDSHFTIVPILCGSLMGSMDEYSRQNYQFMARDFLRVLADIAEDRRTLVVAGVDFSHVGPKFGHDMPASFLLDQSEAHDRRLLDSICGMNADGFWEASREVNDRYNVCGFSALACLLEILPPSHGHLLDYGTFREEATQSAVSFAAVLFVNS